MQPTVGRILRYFHTISKPLAAIVTKVNKDFTLNLTVFNEDGTTMGAINVPFDDGGNDSPTCPYCTWPPAPLQSVVGSMR